VFYGSNLYRKDNPRWPIGNAMETPGAPLAVFRGSPPAGRPGDRLAGALADVAAGIAARARNVCGIGVAWLIGVPLRAGARMHAMNDAEARWWHWDVIECHGGLTRQYRDGRFAALPHDPALRRDETGPDLPGPGAVPPDCQCRGDR